MLLGISSVVLLVLPGAAAAAVTLTQHSCRSIPGDASWPSESSWRSLNQSVHGHLIITTPQAAVCHEGGYCHDQPDASACKALRSTWDNPMT